MRKQDNKSDRRGGYYWFDDKPFVSVTNVLKVIDKPALRRWFGREVYLAMVVNPGLSEAEALAAPFAKSKKAQDRGTAVHFIVETWEKTKEKIDDIPAEYKGYGEAFYNFVKDFEITLVEHEKTVISKQHQYAGTLDLIVKDSRGELMILDVKTGKDIYQEAYIQLSAYKHALKEDHGMDIKRTGVLLLQDGNYKFEETPDCFDVFLSCLSLWRFLNREDADKVGYLPDNK